MTNALRTVITSVKPEIPSWLRPNLVGYWSGGHRDGVYYPLTNATVNGNFPSTTGWSSGTSVLSASDNILSAVCKEGTVTYYHVQKDTGLSYAANTVINVRGQARVLESGVTRLEVRLYVYAINTAFKTSGVFVNNPTANTWYPYSVNLTVPADMANKVLRLWLHTEVPSGTHTGETTQHKQVEMLPLTAIFGLGNEPTATEMDAILAADGTAYWDGTRNVKVSPIDSMMAGLTNLVANGNFANGTGGYTATGSVLSVASNILTIVGNGGSTDPRATATSADNAYAAGKKIYVRMYARVTNSVSIRMAIDLLASGMVSVSIPQNTPTINQWYLVTGVLTMGAGGSGNWNTQYRHQYADAATANGKVMEVQNVMSYDLTAIFGAGNEPTAAQLDAALANDRTTYWDGLRTIPVTPRKDFFWADYSGNNRHGKLSNFAYATGSNLDQYGAMFDGVDDFISIADSPALRLTGGGTLWAWINPKGLGELNVGVIFDKSNGYSGSLGYVFSLSPDNKIRFATNGTGTLSLSNSIHFSKWQMVSVSFNNVGRQIFLNAINVTGTGGSEIALPSSSNTYALTIGNRSSGTDCTFDGQIGLAGICNRALTQVEIKYLFDSTRRRYGI